MTTQHPVDSDVLAYRDNRDEVLVLETELSSDDFEGRWHLASACLDLVDRPGSPEDAQLDWAKRALYHADKAIALDPQRAEGHYYRAIALGRILERSPLAPESKISELEAAGVRARELDPGFGCSGPLRLLGLLYLKAPPWPLGPELAGEEDVIDELFQEGLALSPECPAVRADYAEFLVDMGRTEDALEECLVARRLLAEGKVSERLQDWEIERLAAKIDGLLKSLNG
jgi:hypothetical protein